MAQDCILTHSVFSAFHSASLLTQQGGSVSPLTAAEGTLRPRAAPTGSRGARRTASSAPEQPHVVSGGSSYSAFEVRWWIRWRASRRWAAAAFISPTASAKLRLGVAPPSVVFWSRQTASVAASYRVRASASARPASASAAGVPFVRSPRVAGGSVGSSSTAWDPSGVDKVLRTSLLAAHLSRETASSRVRRRACDTTIRTLFQSSGRVPNLTSTGRDTFGRGRTCPGWSAELIETAPHARASEGLEEASAKRSRFGQGPP